MTGFSPDVDVAAFCSAATAPASLSKAATRAFAASRSANGPTPQNRSAMCLARLQCSDTSAASVSSPATVACRNEPGGSVTCAVPIAMIGGVRISTSSPWRVSRASRCCSAMRDSVAIMAVGSGPEPRTSTSSPLSVAVIWMSSGFPIAISGSAIAHAASSAPSRCRDRESDSGRSERCRANWPRRNPTLSTSCVPIRACSVMRRRPRPWASISGADLAIDPGLRQRRRPRVRASRRGSARPPSAGSRSRRRRRNAGRTARSAPGLRSRPAAGAGGRDGPGPAPTSTVSPRSV